MSNLEDARRKIEALREQRRAANPVRQAPKATEEPALSPPLEAGPLPLAEEGPLEMAEDGPLSSLEDVDDSLEIDLPEVPEGD